MLTIIVRRLFLSRACGILPLRTGGRPRFFPAPAAPSMPRSSIPQSPWCTRRGSGVFPRPPAGPAACRADVSHGNEKSRSSHSARFSREEISDRHPFPPFNAFGPCSCPTDSRTPSLFHHSIQRQPISASVFSALSHFRKNDWTALFRAVQPFSPIVLLRGRLFHSKGSMFRSRASRPALLLRRNKSGVARVSNLRPNGKYNHQKARGFKNLRIRISAFYLLHTSILTVSPDSARRNGRISCNAHRFWLFCRDAKRRPQRRAA